MRAAVLAMALAAAAPAGAGEAWDDISALLPAAGAAEPAGALIALDAPYRTFSDRRTVLGAEVRAPEGEALARVTLVIDENPMPVSASFALAQPAQRFAFEGTFRLDRATQVHVLAETVSGAAFVAEAFVKTSGEGACAAPPGTDPEEALATLGQMEVTLEPAAAGMSTAEAGRAAIDISHPSHSGLQMDQVSLLYIPARYVERVQVDADGAPWLDMTGSISLAENPRLTVSVPPGTGRVAVTLTDSEGTVTRAVGALPGL